MKSRKTSILLVALAALVTIGSVSPAIAAGNGSIAALDRAIDESERLLGTLTSAGRYSNETSATVRRAINKHIGVRNDIAKLDQIIAQREADTRVREAKYNRWVKVYNSRRNRISRANAANALAILNKEHAALQAIKRKTQEMRNLRFDIYAKLERFFAAINEAMRNDLNA